MKKNIYAVALVVTLGLSVFSCKKEEMHPNNNSQTVTLNNETIGLEKSIGTLMIVNKMNGIYKFSNFKELEDLLIDLENRDQTYMSAFYTANKDLSEDALEEKILKTKWNQNQVLDLMDQVNNFKSLRANIELKIKAWENVNADLSIAHPDKHSLTDRYLRSLLTEYGEVIVGNSIFIFQENGVYLEIQNLDFDALTGVKTGQIVKENAPAHVLDNSIGISGGVSWQLSTATGCQRNKTTGWGNPSPSGNRRIYGRLSINNYWAGGNIRNLKSETNSQRKKSNGNWVGVSTYITASAYCRNGYLRNAWCESQTGSDRSAWDDDNGINCTAKVNVDFDFYAASGDVGSTHTGSGITLVKILTF